MPETEARTEHEQPQTVGDLDPYGIVPPEFVERFAEAGTLREALKEAEREPSTTPRGVRERCPSCGGTRIRIMLNQIADNPLRRDGSMRCIGCASVFDDPLPPLVEIATDPRTIDDPTEPTFDELQTIRDALDLPRTTVADRCGWSAATVKKLENGDSLRSPGRVRSAVLDVYREEWADLFDAPAGIYELFSYLCQESEEKE